MIYIKKSVSTLGGKATYVVGLTCIRYFGFMLMHEVLTRAAFTEGAAKR